MTTSNANSDANFDALASICPASIGSIGAKPGPLRTTRRVILRRSDKDRRRISMSTVSTLAEFQGIHRIEGSSRVAGHEPRSSRGLLQRALD